MPLPTPMLASVRKNGMALKTKLLPTPREAATSTSTSSSGASCGLFATVRPLKNLRGLKARFTNVDMLVIREITEDLYAAIEHEIVPGVVQSHQGRDRSGQSSGSSASRFDWTHRAGRKTVHCVHKANILKLADGLFLEAFRSSPRTIPIAGEGDHRRQLLHADGVASRSSSTCW